MIELHLIKMLLTSAANLSTLIHQVQGKELALSPRIVPCSVQSKLLMSCMSHKKSNKSILSSS